MRSIQKMAVWAVAGALALAVQGGIAKADSLKLHFDPDKFSDGPDGGGEFEAYDLSSGFPFADPQGNPPSLVTSGYGAGQSYDPATQKTFQTFCVEDTVYFTPDVLYYTTPTTTLHNGEALTAQVAYLYDQFWNGTLDNYNFTLGNARITSARLLQEAIWTLLNDPGFPLAGVALLPAQSQAWIAEANNAVANTPWGNSIHNVRIIQLSSDAAMTQPAQDQLVEVGPTFRDTIVPLPSTAMAGMILLGSVGALKLRRRAGV